MSKSGSSITYGYNADGKRISKTVNGTTYNGNRYFYLKNAQGDVTGLVNASGTQVVSYTYDPWGAPMSTDGTIDLEEIMFLNHFLNLWGNPL